MFKCHVILAVLSLIAVAAICAGTPDFSSSDPVDRPASAPPDGMVPGTMPPGASSDSSSYLFSGVYMLDGKVATETKAKYTSDKTNTSAVYVKNGGILTLIDPTITTSGDTTSNDASSFFGLNAAVLATSGGRVNITGGNVTTTGSGANGVFATGENTAINLADISINCSGDGGHGVDATLGGSLQLKNVDIVTFGPHSAAIATDRGSGTINAIGGTIVTYGKDSPGIYSTGAIAVRDAVIKGIGAEAAVIEGANSITLTNTSLESGTQTTGGIMIYQSFSGDAENGTGTFSMKGGSISVPMGPVFFSTNTNAAIELDSVKVASASGILIKASATSRWGSAGSNGGRVSFSASDVDIAGSMVCDSVSSIKANLQNGTNLSGAINAENSGCLASLCLDSSSSWNVTATSYLTSLNDDDASLANIRGNGFNVYYNSGGQSNNWLAGKTYSLANGGKLMPEQ